MKRAGGLCIAIFGAAGLFAQGHGGASAGHSGSHVGSRPGGGIIPGGKTAPNINFPASSTPRPRVPISGNRNTGVFYVPIYVPYGGDYGYGYGYDYGDGSYGAPYDPNAAPYPPNVNMYYPPPAYPYPPESAQMRTYVNPYVAQDNQEGAPPLQPDNSASSHYLIALKDHTVAAAVAYYVQGDTLHYFTDGNVHNQVSISQVDRELTDRLNKESGKQVVLTPVKQE